MECGSGHHDIGYRRKNYGRRKMKRSTKCFGRGRGRRREMNFKEKKKKGWNLTATA